MKLYYIYIFLNVKCSLLFVKVTMHFLLKEVFDYLHVYGIYHMKLSGNERRE